MGVVAPVLEHMQYRLEKSWQPVIGTATNQGSYPSKWMVGMEWEMINVLRYIYCRLVLGQTLQPGGQGAGMPHPRAANDPSMYEQAKSVHLPLQGGGILTTPSDFPREVLTSLPGIGVTEVKNLELMMTE